jgi:hypothetical protein
MRFGMGQALFIPLIPNDNNAPIRSALTAEKIGCPELRT